MKYKKVNCLISSAGVATAANIFFALKQKPGLISKIYVASNDKHNALFHLANNHLIVPPISSQYYIDEILRYCLEKAIDIIFPVHSQEISIFSSKINSFEKHNIRVVVPSITAVDLCNNKNMLMGRLSENSISTVKTFLRPSDVQYPVYRKPNFGSSSRGHEIFHRKQSFDWFCKENAFKDFCWQEVANGDEITVDIFCSTDMSKIYCLARQRLRIQDGKAISSKTFHDEKLISICKKIVSLVGIVGGSNIQFFKADNDYKVIEINPRMSAGGLPLTVKSGLNIPVLCIQDQIFGAMPKEIVMSYGYTMHRYLTEVFTAT